MPQVQQPSPSVSQVQSLPAPTSSFSIPPSQQGQLWKTWSIDNYDNSNYDLGITFQYPPYLDGEYLDFGGTGLLSADLNQPHEKRLYFNCVDARRDTLDKQLSALDPDGFPSPLRAEEKEVLKKITTGGHEGVEAILPIDQIIYEGYGSFGGNGSYRLLRFYMENSEKVCEIRASLSIDRRDLDLIIASFRTTR